MTTSAVRTQPRAVPASEAAGMSGRVRGPAALLVSLLLHSRLALSVAVLMGILGGLTGAGLIAVIHRIQQQGRGAFDERALAVFAGVLALRLSSSLVSRLLLVRMGQDVVRHLRTRLAGDILKAPLASMEGLGSPQAMAMLTNDVASVALFFANVPTLCVNGAIVVGCLAYVAALSRPLFAMTVAVAALGIGVYRLLSRYATGRFARARQTENTLFRHLAALTEGFKELKMDSRKATLFLETLLGRTVAAHRRDSVRAHGAYALADLWGGLLFFLPIGIVLFSGLPALTPNESTSSAYVLTILFLVAPMSSVVGLLPIVGSAFVSMRAIHAVAARLPRDGAVPGAPLLRGDAWRLSLEGVGFSYEGPDAFGVGPVDFALGPGEIVFVVGGNGSGKSTFVKLLTGLYPPHSGRVVVDGVPISPELRQRYRDSFSTVFADFRLIPDLPVAADAEAEGRARAYLKLLRLDGLVDLRDGCFSRTDLSAGQRKRLAMVAALLEDRPVIVLDEWAAEQDVEARALFYDTLLPSLRERGTAVVAVTHDDRFFAAADRLVRFDYGRITLDDRMVAHAVEGREPVATWRAGSRDA
jgi:putative ATP-binding cassette transporter